MISRKHKQISQKERKKCNVGEQVKINRKIILRISAFILIALSISAVVYSIVKTREQKSHDPIIIWSNEDMIEYNFEGNGTKVDPFLLNNLRIITTSRYGIYIANTTFHFIISDCYIESEHTGIYIAHSAEDTANVSNNTCVKNEIGIKIVNTDSAKITNNNCSYNEGSGIAILASNKTLLLDNICSYNGEDGIIIQGSNNFYLSNNICQYNTDTGINIRNSESGNSLISTNLCTNNNNGIRALDSNSLNIINNDCSYNLVIGISILGSNYTLFEGNNCNSNGDDGINLYFVNYSIVANNTCIDNFNTGLDLFHVGYLSIVNNEFSGSPEGIFCAGVDYCQILNNTISNNHLGINTVGYVWSWWLDNCNISFNLFQENENYAIVLNPACENTTIHHNSFIDNFLEGTSQAYDRGVNNFWYDTIILEGNFWSDWISGSYAIDGVAFSVDLYPLSEDPLSP